MRRGFHQNATAASQQCSIDGLAWAFMNTFLRSARTHAEWISDSLRPGRHPSAPLSIRRLLSLGLALPPYSALQGLNWAGLALDRWLYPHYATATPEQPLFILGLPRSGTTFVHRSLAAADTEFHSMRTWEALLAPSVCQRRLWQGLAKIDQRWLRGIAQRGLDTLVHWAASGLDEIHSVSLQDAEEDYLALLPAAACFLAVLAFPDREDLWQLGYLDQLPEKQRRRILSTYLDILARQQYAQGHHRRLLSKNAAFGSWAGALASALPEARFLICIREPAKGLDSQLSAIEPTMQALGTHAQPDRLRARFVELFAHQYRHLRQVCTDYPDRTEVVDMDLLAENPGPVLKQALRGLGLPISEQLQAAFEQAQRQGQGHRSRPSQQPLTDIPEALMNDYQALRQRATTSPLPMEKQA